MVMPNKQLDLIAEAFVQGNRSSFWISAVFNFVRAGLHADAAALEADALLAAYDARCVTPTKTTFGLNKQQG